MWKNILKVDEFTDEINAKAIYDSEFDKIKVNLDNFSSRSKIFDDEDRIEEFSNVVAHENVHREYDKIIGDEMRKALSNVIEATKKYSQIPYDNFEEKANEIPNLELLIYSYLNYAVVNEKFAFTTGGPDMTTGSIRSVLSQISKTIREIIGKKDRKIDRLLSKINKETMTAIEK
jgi:hypothetical protein|tara:strand:+ start:52 stop:576 length:525 start_codon:yes stop_codon:yes gene_type:complete